MPYRQQVEEEITQDDNSNDRSAMPLTPDASSSPQQQLEGAGGGGGDRISSSLSITPQQQDQQEHYSQSTTDTTTRLPSRPARYEQQEEQQYNSEEEEEEDEEDGLLFSCQCESVKPVLTLLSSLRNVSNGIADKDINPTNNPSSSRSNLLDVTAGSIGRRRGGYGGYGGGSGGGSRVQIATVTVSEDRLVFRVYGVGRQSRATVDMQVGLFSEFYVAESTVPIIEEDDDDNLPSPTKKELIKGGEFAINLTTVLECLSILGPTSLDRTKLFLSYDAKEAIFKIELLEDDSTSAASSLGDQGSGMGSGGGMILSNCAIPGMSVAEHQGLDDDEDNEGLDYAFRLHPIVARARIRSDVLKEAINELADVAGAMSATIIISRKGLELTTFGHSTECLVVLPYVGNHPEVFISLEGTGHAETSAHGRKYPLHSILSAMRGLDIASETCISMNENGMIVIQHQVNTKVGNGEPNYVDFIMGCLEEELIGDVETAEVEMTQASVVESNIQDEESQNQSMVYDDNDDNDDNGVDNNQSQSQSQKEVLGNGTRNSRMDGNDSGSETEDEQESPVLTRQSKASKTSEEDSGSETDGEEPNSSLLFGGLAKNMGVIPSQSNSQRSRLSRRQGKNGQDSSSMSPQDHRSMKRRRRHIQLSSESQQPGSEHSSPEKEHLTENENDSENDSENEDTQEEMTNDIENSPDLEDTVVMSFPERRKTESRSQTSTPSSPQLMYGDTHLER